jgi:dienelactone hydrolase
MPDAITQPPGGTTPSPIAALPALETAPPYEQLAALFDYDHSSPPEVQEKQVQSKDGAQIHDIAFTDSNGNLQKAFLVTPSIEGPYAAIEFFSWSGRYSFLDEAISYAQMGVVSLLLDNPFNPTHTSAETDRQQLIQTVVDLRQGLDLLLSQPEVDPTRLAFVGHSDGAIFGAVLAGVDKRPAAYVLMAGTGHKSKDLEASLDISDPAGQEAYLKAVSQLDGIHFIGHAAPAALFFQNGTQDGIVSESDALEFQQAGSEPKTIKMYATGHELNLEAKRDRSAWLQEQLQLKSRETNFLAFLRGQRPGMRSEWVRR